MTRVDQEGIPCIVQEILFDRYRQGLVYGKITDMIGCKYFDGSTGYLATNKFMFNETHMPESQNSLVFYEGGVNSLWEDFANVAVLKFENLFKERADNRPSVRNADGEMISMPKWIVSSADFVKWVRSYNDFEGV